MLARLTRSLPSDRTTRALIYSTLAGSSSRALFLTMSAIFFTRSVGLSTSRVGLGLTIAAAVALFVGVPAGHLADRVGPRTIAVAALAVRSTGMLGYLAVSEFFGFVAVATVLAVLEAAGAAAHGAVIAGAIAPENRVRTRALLRSVTNVGWAIGAVGAGAALQVGTRTGYTVVIGVCVAFGLLGAALQLRVPPVAPTVRPKDAPRLEVLRDKPYLALAVLNGILCIHYGMLNVAVPLWVVLKTSAPAWVVGMLALLNAVVVILFQVRASHGTSEATGAAAAQRMSGFLLAGACLLYAAASGAGAAWVATVVLVGASLVHVLGELRQAAGSWGISFDLAPDHAQGQYQGMYNTGWSLSAIIAPALLTLVVVGWGTPGWILFAITFAVTGIAIPLAVRWARRDREPVPGLT